MNLLKGSSRRIFYPIAVILLLTASTTLALAIRPSYAATAGSKTGIVIPLYTYPTDSTWTTAIQVHNAHPNVPMIVIADPTSSGAGASIDQNFVTGINNMQAAGITVLGYVDTVYAGRGLASAENDVTHWANWYHPNGIFFDEFGGSMSYYTTLNTFVKGLGLTYTMGNPGTTVPHNNYGILDSLVISENPSYPSLSLLSSETSGYSKSGFAYLAYGVSLNTSYEVSSTQYVSWLYITSAGGGNPWNALPSYFSNEVAAIDSPGTTSSTTSTTSTTSSTLTSTSTTTTSTASSTTSSTTSTTASSGSTASLSISTVDQSNLPLSGFYIQSVVDTTTGLTTASGLYTPHTLTGLIVGHTYSVTIDDYSPSYVAGASVGTFSRTTANGGGGIATFALQGTTNVAFTMSPSQTTSTTTTSTTSASTTTASTSTTSTSATTTTSTTSTSTSSTTTSTATSTSTATTTTTVVLPPSTTTTTVTSTATTVSTLTQSPTTTSTSTLAQPFNFALIVTPSSDVVTQGASDNLVVSVSLTGGSPAQVALSATGAPQGLSVSFSPNSGSPGFVSAMRLAVSSGLSPGDYKITVVAQSNQVIQSQEYVVSVTASQPAKYTLTTISPSGSGTMTPTPSTYPHSANDLVTFSAAPDNGWVLDHWLVNGVSAGNGLSLSLIMTGNVQVQAVFSSMAQKGPPSSGTNASVSFLSTGNGESNLMIDGRSYPLPVSFSWTIGSTHVAAATDTLKAGDRTGVFFSAWGGSVNSTQRSLSFKVTGDSNLIANYQQRVLVSMSYTTSGGTPVTPASVVINGPKGFETLGSANSTLWLDTNTRYTLVSAQVMGVNADPLNQASSSFVLTKPQSLTFPLSVYPVQLKLVDLFGQPIQGAQVELTTEGGQVLQSVTDGAGVASFDAVPSGWFDATYSYLGVSGHVQDSTPGPHVETATLALSYPLISVGVVIAGVVAASGVREWRRRRYISTAFD